MYCIILGSESVPTSKIGHCDTVALRNTQKLIPPVIPVGVAMMLQVLDHLLLDQSLDCHLAVTSGICYTQSAKTSNRMGETSLSSLFIKYSVMIGRKKSSTYLVHHTAVNETRVE